MPDKKTYHRYWNYFHKFHRAKICEWLAIRGHRRGIPFPALPQEFQNMTCEAKTRAGTACKQKGLYMNGRCHLHGGKSTGPKTEKGREQSRINGCKGGRPKKPKPMTT